MTLSNIAAVIMFPSQLYCSCEGSNKTQIKVLTASKIYFAMPLGMLIRKYFSFLCLWMSWLENLVVFMVNGGIDCNQRLLSGVVKGIDSSLFVHKMWKSLLIVVYSCIAHQKIRQMNIHAFFHGKNRLFIAHLSNFCNKVAVFSFILLS